MPGERVIAHRAAVSTDRDQLGDRLMPRMRRLLHWAEEVFPPKLAHAHCDLPCGVYDPAQARIEAESVKACQEKFQASEDESFRQRAVMIKEERAELVKHHLWVLWTDYFKAEHLQGVPQLHVIFWKATKAAGAAKKSNDPADGQKLLDAIAEVDAAFRATKA
jgi:nickel superoxide dismutase